MPSTISRKFTYEDNLALLHSFENWKAFDKAVSQYMTTSSSDLRAELSHTMTAMAVFHLNNQEIKHELNVYNSIRLLPFFPTPFYLGEELKRSLAICHHLVALHKTL